jgi:hypothetical protein
VLQDALILFVDNISESWVVDSGASFHSTPHKNHFLDYVQDDFGQVHLGDEAPCKIVGMVLTGENERFPTGRVDPVRGLNTAYAGAERSQAYPKLAKVNQDRGKH